MSDNKQEVEKQSEVVIHETDTFKCVKMVIPGDYSLPQYVVINKQWNIVEFANPTFFYVKEWMSQMEEQLAKDTKQEEMFPTEIVEDDSDKGYN